MIATNRLRLVCSTDSHRASIHRVFVSVAGDGTRRAIATDGYVALLIEVGDDYEPPGRDDGDPEPPDLLALIESKPDSRSIGLADLDQWAGEWIDATCDSCGGRGTCICKCNGTHECSVCMGQGRSLAVAHGRIGPCVIDKNKLAFMLRGLPLDLAGEVRVEWSDATSAVHVVGDGWLGLAMPLSMPSRAGYAADALFDDEVEP